MGLLKLTDQRLIDKLVCLPETGMGYQIVDITCRDGGILENISVINASLVKADIKEEDIIDFKMSGSK